jgi:hypothetical protein
VLTRAAILSKKNVECFTTTQHARDVTRTITRRSQKAVTMDLKRQKGFSDSCIKPSHWLGGLTLFLFIKSGFTITIV